MTIVNILRVEPYFELCAAAITNKKTPPKMNEAVKKTAILSLNGAIIAQYLFIVLRFRFHFPN